MTEAAADERAAPETAGNGIVLTGIDGLDELLGGGVPRGHTVTVLGSFGTGKTQAMSLRTFSHGTVMWIPLAGRIESGCVPSSSARTSSLHTPAALTTVVARTSTVVPSISTRAPRALPSSDLRISTTGHQFTTTAP